MEHIFAGESPQITQLKETGGSSAVTTVTHDSPRKS